jgi:serine phosphatase RsbU (regulator of sigma subunit)
LELPTGSNLNNNVDKTSLSALLQRVASRFSIKQVFTFSFMLQYILVAGLIAALLIQGGQQAVNVILKEIRQEVLARVHEQLAYHMGEPVQLNRLNVNAWNAGLLNLSDHVSRERYFANNIRAFPDVAMTFIGLNDGAFYGARRKESGEIQVVRNNKETGGDSWYYSTTPQGDAVERQEVFQRFDPRTRPWYESGKRTGGPSFSGVYRHFVFREPTITAAHPLYDAEGKLIGVFGVDYLLSWLGDTLRGIPVGASGQIFITDTEGYLVATSTQSALFEEKDGRLARIKATNAANPILKRAALAFLDNGLATVREFSYDNRSYLVDVKAYRESGVDWRIHVVFAADDYLGGFNNAVARTATIIALAIVVAFFVVLWTTGWVTRPILRLNAAAGDLAGGQLSAVPDTERRDELGQLTRSFNTMAQQITSLVESLEQKVEERTKALAEKTNEEKRLREALYTELEKAGREQRAMLPPDMEETKASLRIIYEPHAFVSGDFCGYHWMKKDLLFGYLIDVTGHGVATALQTAAINAMIRETVSAGFSLYEIMNELNRRVGDYLKDETLVAACCFELDFKQKQLRYISAGITEFFADSLSIKGRVKTPGSFLGASMHPEFEVFYMGVQDGDVICFYSDGIADKLTGGTELPINVEFDDFLQSVRNIAVNGALRDDATAMCIKVGRLP